MTGPAPIETRMRAFECADVLLHEFADRLTPEQRDRCAQLWGTESVHWTIADCGEMTALYINVAGVRT